MRKSVRRVAVQKRSGEGNRCSAIFLRAKPVTVFFLIIVAVVLVQLWDLLAPPSEPGGGGGGGLLVANHMFAAVGPGQWRMQDGRGRRDFEDLVQRWRDVLGYHVDFYPGKRTLPKEDDDGGGGGGGEAEEEVGCGGGFDTLCLSRTGQRAAGPLKLEGVDYWREGESAEGDGNEQQDSPVVPFLWAIEQQQHQVARYRAYSPVAGE